VLADVLPLVRFPTMTTMEVASKVTTSGVLESTQVLELFTYLATKAGGGSGGTPGSSLARFSTKARAPRKKSNWFAWDPSSKNSALTLSNENYTVMSTSSSYQPVFGTTELKSGVHEFEITLDVLFANNFSVVVGFAPASSKSRFSSSMMIGYSNHIPGWSYAPYHQRKYHNRMDKYGSRRCNQGDTIRVRLDLDSRTLQFWLNGEACATTPAFTDVVGPVVPALSLYGRTTVTLKFPK